MTMLDGPSFFLPRHETIRPPARPRFEWLGVVVSGVTLPDPPTTLPANLLNQFNTAVSAQDFPALVRVAAAAFSADPVFGSDLARALGASTACRNLPAGEQVAVEQVARTQNPTEADPVGAVISILNGTHAGFKNIDFSSPAQVNQALQVLNASAQLLRDGGAPKTAALMQLRRGVIADTAQGSVDPQKMNTALRKHAQILEALCTQPTTTSPGQPTGTIPTPQRIEELLNQHPQFRALVEDAFKTNEPGSLRTIADSAEAAGAIDLANELRDQADKMETAPQEPAAPAKRSWLPVVIGVIVVGGVVVAIAAGAGD